MPSRYRLAIFAVSTALSLLAAVGLLGLAGVLDSEADTRTVELEGREAQPPVLDAGPATLTLREQGLEALEDAEDTDAGSHTDGADESPAGVPGPELAAGLRQQDRLALSDRLPDLTPLAAPSQPGCRTRLVGNYSSRNGVRPRAIVLHYTVSRNRPGFADVDGITAYFNNPGSSASSHYVVDDVGNCNYIVRETSKAWTQATFNPVSISIEQIAYGDEPDYAKAGGYAKLARIVRDAARRWKIPLQRGAVSGCTITRPGVVDHRQLGRCGGGHHDVNPWGERAIARVIREAKAGSPSASKLVPLERRLANRRCYHRAEHLAGRKRASNLKWARHYRRRIRARIRAIPGSRPASRPARRAELERYYSGRACKG